MKRWPGRGQPVHRPAGQRAREFGDVGLGIAAVDAERVQLQYLAREILVEPAPCAAPAAEARSELAGCADSGPIDWAWSR